MRPNFRVSWLMYNSKRRRIERRIRYSWCDWESFSANKNARVQDFLYGNRWNSWCVHHNSLTLRFYPKKSIRTINQKRIKLGARPVNPMLIRKMSCTG